MALYIVKRLGQALVAMFVVALVVFLLVRLAPGDPARFMLPETASNQEVELLRSRLGLDRPLPVQFGWFMKDMLTLDLGTSFFYNRPVAEIIRLHFPNTALLAGVSLFLSLLIGIPLGIISAVKEGRLADYVAMGIAVIGQSVPVFWLGFMLVLVFSVKFQWLPTSGTGTWKHLVLPATTLSAFTMALISRLVRSGMLDILGEDYIRTARAKGLSESLVVLRHGFRNLMIPVVTVIGLSVGVLLAGSVVTEAVFAWPGVGLMIMTAVGARDYPMIQAFTLFIAFLIIIVNLIVDLLYVYLDPRIRL
jgi:peptide/nickel transport system permease protein/oligopeptide transport system permease protein